MPWKFDRLFFVEKFDKPVFDYGLLGQQRLVKLREIQVFFYSKDVVGVIVILNFLTFLFEVGKHNWSI